MYLSLRKPVILAFPLLLGLPGLARAQVPCAPGVYDGSYRLETGEVITGGLFVEEGRGAFIYLDTEGLARGGLFAPVGEDVLRSIVPDGSIEVRFEADSGCEPERIIWNEKGREPLVGARVFPHDTRELTFTSEDGTELEGRLLVPRCEGPHPAVVYVHGSGPVDRHNAQYQTFLLQHGVAVLSYDKRGFTSDTDAFHRPDMSTLASDAAAAARHLALMPGIDTERIGFIGSSQAGWTVPLAAAEVEDVAFMMLRAGAAVSEFETHLHEKRQEFREEGVSGLDLDYAVDLLREIYGVAVEGHPLTATDELVAPYVEEGWYQAAFGEGPISGRWSSEWWTWAQRNFPVEATAYVAGFDGPVLWFLGERDQNVPLVPTRAALERAFTSAPGGDHQIVVIEDAPHSFLIPGPDGLPRFADGFFDRVIAWMAERSFTAPGCWGQ